MGKDIKRATNKTLRIVSLGIFIIWVLCIVLMLSGYSYTASHINGLHIFAIIVFMLSIISTGINYNSILKTVVEAVLFLLVCYIGYVFNVAIVYDKLYEVIPNYMKIYLTSLGSLILPLILIILSIIRIWIVKGQTIKSNKEQIRELQAEISSLKNDIEKLK